MNRYQDNISPEPNVGLNLNDCYKTPNLQHYNNLFTMNHIYPTPPSDNEETTFNEHVTENKIDNLVTPTIPPAYYGMNSLKNDSNESQDGSLVYNQNNTSLDEQTQYSKKQTDSESALSNHQTSNRFKRRSRTTYTKSQLDALEATFQKTHYPEIRVVDDLSQMLNLSTERISIWFQNRRARFKKARKLETQENRYMSENTAQYPTVYPTNHCYQNLNNMPTYNQYYLNNDKLKSLPKLPDNSSPIVTSNKYDNYPVMDRNILNIPSNHLKSNLDASSSQLINPQFYSNISNLQSTGNNLINGSQFYHTPISSQLQQGSNGFYQPSMNYLMGYPNYQSNVSQ